MNQVNAESRSDLTTLNEANAARMESLAAQLRAEFRADLTEGLAGVRREMQEGFAALSVQIAGVRSDLMKWSFAFWVGAVLAIAGLAGVLCVID